MFSSSFVFGETRDWTNSSGKTITAELIEVSGDKVVLKMNGKNFEVPKMSLSSPDQEFIEEWNKSAPMETGADSEIEPNWDGEWPKLVSADISQEIEVISENEEASEYIYASPHYEFICDVKLNTSVVKRFSLLFEATNQFCRELPIGMIKPFREERHKIHLFEHYGGYVEKGGPEGSAGVYISRGGEGDILVPLTSLGVKKVGSNFSVDYDKENTTLSHEIAHQLTDWEYYAPGSRGWFTEGMAEYIAQSGYRSGKFNVNDLQKLKDYVTAFGEDGRRGRNLGDEIKSPRLKDFFQQTYESFTARSNFNYGMGALVVYYFFHMDGEKDAANIKNFLKGLKDGAEGDAMYEPLLAGRTWEEMEDAVTKGWRSRGVRIEFR
ncbi:MAG: SHD1 domain-containing protein [Verrucomicrobiota bacterium]